jgi:hypothetical protein
MSTIPWPQLVADGVVTQRQADELKTVLVRHPTGGWSFNFNPNGPDDHKTAAERVVLALCAAGRAH